MRFRCVEGCSDCCIYREYYPDKSYGKVGVLILPSERDRMEGMAENLGIRIEILPRLGAGSKFNDGRKTGPRRVIAYQLMGVREDGNLCPFLDVDGKERSPHGGFRCMIHEHRPLACRAYPLIEYRDGIKLDSKCKFCKPCSGSVEGLERERGALARIEQELTCSDRDLWRYATGIGGARDAHLIRKGWVLETSGEE